MQDTQFKNQLLESIGGGGGGGILYVPITLLSETSMQIDMTITELAAAVDAGKFVIAFYAPDNTIKSLYTLSFYMNDTNGGTYTATFFSGAGNQPYIFTAATINDKLTWSSNS